MNSVDKKRRWAKPFTGLHFKGYLLEDPAMDMTRRLGYAVISVLAVAAFQTLVAGQPSGAATQSKTKSTAKAPAKPAVRAAAAKSPITISLTSTMRRGNLVVVLDDVPVFNEKFQKPFFLISQTTQWDPLQVAAGKHRLSAKVYGTTKTYLSATYDLDVSRTKGSALRFRMKGDKLTVELGS
jgi:hypothetical protein